MHLQALKFLEQEAYLHKSHLILVCEVLLSLPWKPKLHSFSSFKFHITNLACDTCSSSVNAMKEWKDFWGCTLVFQGLVLGKSLHTVVHIFLTNTMNIFIFPWLPPNWMKRNTWAQNSNKDRVMYGKFPSIWLYCWRKLAPFTIWFKQSILLPLCERVYYSN